MSEEDATPQPQEIQPQPQPYGQPLLFSTKIEWSEDEKTGQITLERIRIRKPWLIPAVIELLGRGEGQLSIAAMLGTHHRVVSKIQLEHPQAIAIARRVRADRLRQAADKLVEQILDHPDLVPWNVKALAANQLNQMAELLDGRPTGRVEHTKRVEIFDDYQDYIAQLPAADAQDLPPAIAAGPEIGLAGEKEKAHRDPRAPELADAPADLESDVQAPGSQGDRPTDTAADADPGTREGGGGGSGAPAGGASLHASKPAQEF